MRTTVRVGAALEGFQQQQEFLSKHGRDLHGVDLAGPKQPVRLDPTVLIPGDLGHMFAAGVPVNQIDDECPHDRTPLLISDFNTRAMFRDRFV